MKNRATSERLHGFLNDLESLMALPFLRAGGEPAQVVSILLETLVGMLGLAFAFVRLDDPDGGLSIRTAIVTEALERSICAREIGEALEMSLADVPLKWPPRRRLSIGDMEFSISSTELGLQGEFGVLVAGAQKAGGVTRESVHRANDDPSNVLVIHGFGTFAEAETFLNGSELRDTMQTAGVEGRPRIEIYHDA